jgi:hypothetical protein
VASATPREEFLLKMYEACWQNVTTAGDAVWKVFASYVAVFAGLSFAGPFIGIEGFLLLVIVFSGFGMIVCLNGNLWFERNIGMISNIEKEFLLEMDYNVIIPKKWQQHEPSFVTSEIWWVMFLLFLATAVVLNLVMLPQLSFYQQFGVGADIVIMGVIVYFYYVTYRDRDAAFQTDAPGKKLS